MIKHLLCHLITYMYIVSSFHSVFVYLLPPGPPPMQVFPPCETYAEL